MPMPPYTVRYQIYFLFTSMPRWTDFAHGNQKHRPSQGLRTQQWTQSATVFGGSTQSIQRPSSSRNFEQLHSPAGACLRGQAGVASIRRVAADDLEAPGSPRQGGGNHQGQAKAHHRRVEAPYPGVKEPWMGP